MDVSKRHRFSKNNLNLFNAWITAIQNTVLASKSVEEVYLSYYVCGRHFAPESHVPGTLRGLMVNAVPSLFLPVLDNRLISPFIFDYNLTGNGHLELLTNEIMPVSRQIINPENKGRLAALRVRLKLTSD
ncbi:hypothetical protein FQA39_LY09461 [Lamprigera yunnana]|nr:hypothetical protein FQA39_LY09461 [Lamprigera yunnana]